MLNILISNDDGVLAEGLHLLVDALKTIPNINIDVGVQADMSTEIVPTNPILTITFSIYIPFHRSSAELDLIYNFFKFIQANYNELSRYIYKYIKQDVTIPPGSVGAGESMLKEELLYNIFENSLFLKEINKECINTDSEE